MYACIIGLCIHVCVLSMNIHIIFVHRILRYVIYIFVDTASRWVFDVANRGEPNPYAESCIAWYSEQQALLQTVSSVSNLVCPCNRLQAIYDERFFYDYSTDYVYSLFTSQGYYLVSII